MCDVCMRCMHAIVDRAHQFWLWVGERRDCDGWNSEKRDIPTCGVSFPGQGSYCHRMTRGCTRMDAQAVVLLAHLIYSPVCCQCFVQGLPGGLLGHPRVPHMIFRTQSHQTSRFRALPLYDPWPWHMCTQVVCTSLPRPGPWRWASRWHIGPPSNSL